MKRLALAALLTGFFLFLSSVIVAQDTISFTEGLVVGSAGRRGRSAVFTDPIYYQLVTGKFKEPFEGDSVGVNYRDEVQRWKKIIVGESGYFEDGDLRGGFLYLTYDAPAHQIAIIEISGHSEIFINEEPHGGDVYDKGWVIHPVHLKKGRNIFLVKGSRGKVKISISPLKKPLFFSTRDMTTPDLLIDENDQKIAAVKIVNATEKHQKGLRIEAELNGRVSESQLPSIIPMSTRKVAYSLIDNASEAGKVDVTLKLYRKGKLLDEAVISYVVKRRDENYKRTFTSEIDGSVQYFGVREGQIPEGQVPAMFLSVHGAGVEGIGQAAAYKNKDWGHVIAPTNRREFGFDWEDWGRWDAMEVQSIAEKMYATDINHTYLTGHSMGGHGTWQLGAIFPGKWAAIAPVAGWYSFFSYGGESALDDPIPIQSMLLRAANSSNTLELSRNYLHYGVYILHGEADKNVPVTQARFMRAHLANFHPDFVYYEEPDAGHWFGVDKEPIFHYFKWHHLPENRNVKQFEFRTASPGVSSTTRFITLYQQAEPFVFCGVKVKQAKLTRREKGLDSDKIIETRSVEIETENLSVFKLNLGHCAGADTLTIKVDDNIFEDMDEVAGKDIWFGREKDTWKRIDAPTDTHQKNPARYGNFKDAFQHRMLFVYATKGSREENRWSYNKARFDAETFYYRGNGSIDIIPDHEFSLAEYKDRSVIIYGNATTNTAWKLLLDESPVQVRRNEMTVGEKKLNGEQWGIYFIRPRKDSRIASVGVISGTGMTGFNSVLPNRYFVSGTGFPDLMIVSPGMFIDGYDGVKAAGYFGNDWSLDPREIVWSE